MNDLERVINQIKRRSWEKMRANWMSSLALVDLNIGSGLEGVLDLEQIAAELLAERKTAEENLQKSLRMFKEKQIAVRPKKGSFDARAEETALVKYEQTRRPQVYSALAPKREAIPSIREVLFGEGLRLAEKAFHVLGCSESDAHKGNRSWSLCSAYQAGLFASKALLALCGIGFVEINGRTLVVDIFPDPVKEAEDYKEATFSYVSHRFDHRAVWQLFQRVLAVTVDAPWPKEAVDKLKEIEDKHFAKHRNDIQYRNTHWPFEDLFAFLTDGDFGQIAHWNAGSDDLDFDRPDISIVVAFYILKMNLALLNELGIASAKLRPHVDRFFQCSIPERHPMYHALLPFAAV